MKLPLAAKGEQMKGMFGPVVLAAVAVLLGSASPAWCATVGPSIVVDPDPGTSPPGEYDYSLAVTGSATFNAGDEIYFSGMSGVTSASAKEEVSFAFGNYVTFTSSTAAFVMGYPPTIPCSGPDCLSDTFPDDQGAPYGYFEIDPPLGLTTGAINWSIIQNGVTTYSGTVPGPVGSVAPTPEPSSFVLLGTGLLALAGAVKFRYLYHGPPPWARPAHDFMVR